MVGVGGWEGGGGRRLSQTERVLVFACFVYCLSFIHVYVNRHNQCTIRFDLSSFDLSV